MSESPRADGELPQHAASVRVARARARAIDRQERQRSQSRPLLIVATVIVVAGQFAGDPAPGVTGTALAVTICLFVYVAAVSAIIIGGWPDDDRVARALVLVVGGAGISLAGLSPQGAQDLAPSVAVMLATVRLPRPLSLRLAAGIAAGLGAVSAATINDPGVPVAAELLLCGLLATFGLFIRESRLGQDRTELLLAELEDAREAGEAAAAGAERARIARDLHDVLAHSLSGLAIQVEGARKLAARDGASPELREVLDRSRALVAEGLAEAKAAVGALRARPPAPATDGVLSALVDSYRHDFGLDIDLRVEGRPPSEPTVVGETLHRVAQEALTNVARHAPGARVQVRLTWARDGVVLEVTDTGRSPGATPAPPGTGSGRGLQGMRERVAAHGGLLDARACEGGWKVAANIPSAHSL